MDEAKLLAFLDAVPRGILTVNREGVIVFANAQAHQLLNYGPGELEGYPLQLLIPARFRLAHLLHSEAFFARTAPRAMIGREVRACRKDGSEFPVEVSLGYAEVQRAGLAVVFITDLTEQKRLEQQLAQTQKMGVMGELVSGVAHDFNNLLMVIAGYTDLALRDIREDNAINEALRQVQEAASRATTLTRHLLAFSRRQVVEPHSLDLNELLRPLGKLLRRLIGERVELVLALSQERAPIVADAGQIEQVVFNLAINASDAMPHGGKLMIETASRLADGHILLAVTDTGCGMSEEIQQHIFDPFFTTKPKGKGTGLGLSTVYRIVKQSGGTISVHSELGNGTTFRILFPRSEAGEYVAAGQAQSAAADSTGIETVLVVEDDAEVRRYVTRVLERHGYRVLEAGSGEEAILAARQFRHRIDALLTDLVLPHMSGLELADQLTAARAGLAIIFMSGYTDRVIALEGRFRNRAQLVQKPMSPARLLAMVRTACAE